MLWLLKFETTVRNNEKVAIARENATICNEDYESAIQDLYTSFEGTDLARDLECLFTNENGDDIEHTFGELEQIYENYYERAYELCLSRISGSDILVNMNKLSKKLGCDIIVANDNVEVWNHDDDVGTLQRHTDTVRKALSDNLGIVVEEEVFTITYEDELYNTLYFKVL